MALFSSLHVSGVINWPIWRFVDRADPPSYDLIKAAIRSHRVWSELNPPQKATIPTTP